MWRQWNKVTSSVHIKSSFLSNYMHFEQIWVFMRLAPFNSNLVEPGNGAFLPGPRGAPATLCTGDSVPTAAAATAKGPRGFWRNSGHLLPARGRQWKGAKQPPRERRLKAGKMLRWSILSESPSSCAAKACVSRGGRAVSEPWNCRPRRTQSGRLGASVFFEAGLFCF